MAIKREDTSPIDELRITATIKGSGPVQVTYMESWSD